MAKKISNVLVAWDQYGKNDVNKEKFQKAVILTISTIESDNFKTDVGHIRFIDSMELLENSIKESDVLLCYEMFNNTSIGAGQVISFKEKNPNLAIILIVDDKKKGNAKLKKMYDKGVYDALFIKDFDKMNLKNLIVSPRNKEDALVYYGLENYVDLKEKKKLEKKRIAESGIDEDIIETNENNTNEAHKSKNIDTYSNSAKSSVRKAASDKNGQNKSKAISKENNEAAGSIKDKSDDEIKNDAKTSDRTEDVVDKKSISRDGIKDFIKKEKQNENSNKNSAGTKKKADNKKSVSTDKEDKRIQNKAERQSKAAEERNDKDNISIDRAVKKEHTGKNNKVDSSDIGNFHNKKAENKNDEKPTNKEIHKANSNSKPLKGIAIDNVSNNPQKVVEVSTDDRPFIGVSDEIFEIEKQKQDYIRNLKTAFSDKEDDYVEDDSDNIAHFGMTSVINATEEEMKGIIKNTFVDESNKVDVIHMTEAELDEYIKSKSIAAAHIEKFGFEMNELDHYQLSILNYYCSVNPQLMSNLEQGLLSKEEFKEDVIRKITEYTTVPEQVDELYKRFSRFMWDYDCLTDIIADPTVSDIKLYGPENIRIKRKGHREAAGVRFLSKEHYSNFVSHLLRRNNVNVTDEAIYKPTDKFSSNEARLRINVTLEFINSSGLPVVQIRKISNKKMTTEELIARGFMTNYQAGYLIDQAQNSSGMVFTGKGSAGKTTAINWAIEYIPHDKSGIILQETDELYSDTHPDLDIKRIATSRDGKYIYDLFTLSANALLTDIDYFIIGEIKGREATQFTNAVYTGNKCWTSVHSPSAYDAIPRLVNLAKYGSDFSREELLEMLSSLSCIVFMHNWKVVQICEVLGYSPIKKDVVYKELI